MLKVSHLFLLVFILFSETLVYAEESVPPAFSDPLKYQQTEPGWAQQGIRYVDGLDADLVLSVDQNLYGILAPLIHTYASKHQLKIAVQKGTCGISAGKLYKKQIDIGGFCCPPGSHDRLQGLAWHTLGILPIEVIVHPDNPINNLTSSQIRSIFSGELFNWKQLQVKHNQFIHTVARLHCKLRPGHWRLLLDNEDAFSPEITEVAAIEDMIRMVASDPAAIGYEVPSMIEHYKKAGRVKAITINGIDAKNAINGTYPLYRVYNLTSWSSKHIQRQEAVDLIRYLTNQMHIERSKSAFISADTLKQHGWRFLGDELIGPPQAGNL